MENVACVYVHVFAVYMCISKSSDGNAFLERKRVRWSSREEGRG